MPFADCVTMLQVLQKLADMQTVDYGFEVYQLPMHCDAPLTVLSCGSSLLRSSIGVQIPLQPTAEFGEHRQHRHKCSGSCMYDVSLVMLRVQALSSRWSSMWPARI